MIVGEGLIRTGALEPVGRFLAKLWRRGPAISLLFTILITAVLSAFINNTPIVVLMLPILMGVAVRMGESPSGTLIPMGFASILGGMATTIGTSTNLLVVSVAADLGLTEPAVAGGVTFCRLREPLARSPRAPATLLRTFERRRLSTAADS